MEKEALNYLLNERKFTIEDIQKYKIGLADSYGLKKHLQKKQYK